MSKLSMVVIGVVVLVVGYFFVTYNSLVSANEKINGQWAQVASQYQRRIDLIPNLVESVKGVMAQEQSIFTALAEARTQYAGAVSVDQKAAAATQVESSFGRLLAIMENYPQLKSSENVQTLMAQLEGTENRISVERMRYNEFVRDFNIRIKSVPTKWVAGMFGYSERSYFEASAGSENAPKVNLQK